MSASQGLLIYACENPQSRVRVVLIDPAVVVAHHPVGRFHLRMQEDAFLKIDPTSRSPSPGPDRMVAVFDAKTGQGEFLDARDAVTVRILKKNVWPALTKHPPLANSIRGMYKPSAKTVDLSARPSRPCPRER